MRRRERRLRDRELTRISRAYNDGLISLNEYLAQTEEVRTGRPRTPTRAEVVGPPPDFLRCFVCHGTLPDGHGDHCFMRPGALTTRRGGIEYERPSRGTWLDGPRPGPGVSVSGPLPSAGTPLYDELAAERGIDPVRAATVRHNERTFRELSERFARSAAVPGPMLVLPPDPPELVIRGARPADTANLTQWRDDPVVERARELYRLGHFGDVGTLTARRALARMIGGRALDDARPRTRTGWGQPIERTDP